MTTYTVERYGNRIRLTGPPAPQQCRSIPGASFSKYNKWWTFNLHMEICRDLRRAFGDELSIGPELNTWARAELAKYEATKPLLSALTAELESLPTRAPVLHAALQNRPYQLPAVAVMAKRGTWLEADQPGLGKTIVTLGAIVERHNKGQFLVVAPKTSLRTVWEPEIRRWLAGVAGNYSVTVAAADGRSRREGILAGFSAAAARLDRPAYMFLLVNPEMIRVKETSLGCACGEEDCDKYDFQTYGGNNPGHKEAFVLEENFPQLQERVWTGIVGDEIHKMLIRKNGRPTQTRLGMMSLKHKAEEEGGSKYALSGTPFKGKTQNIWGTLNWLRPMSYTSYWNWAKKYMEMTEDEYSTMGIVGELLPESQEAFYRSLDDIMIRRTKKELRTLNPAWAPPEKLYESVLCTMEPKQDKLYRAMEKNAQVALQDGDLIANGVLAEMTRLKQFAHACGNMQKVVRNDETFLEFRPALPSAKFDQILQRLEERGISGAADERGGDLKVVIGSQFTTMLKLYNDELNRLGIPTFILTGATRDADRVAQVAAWQQPGGPRVFLINTAAGGVSITLDAADELWVLDETWVPDEQEQLEDRIHRTGNVNHQVTISYFVTAGTIEERIAEVTATRDATQKEHLDGRRGVEFAKQWLQKVGSG